jgi:hypothetical protein
MKPPLPFIVAEISKNWGDGPTPSRKEFLGRTFEEVILTNKTRGYRLHSWKLSRIAVDPTQLNETIVAVFEKEEP